MKRDSITGHAPPGTRVRLKVRTMFGGWRGTATMLSRGVAVKDGCSTRFPNTVLAAPHEWAIMRDQTPNPEHAQVLTDDAQ